MERSEPISRARYDGISVLDDGESGEEKKSVLYVTGGIGPPGIGGGAAIETVWPRNEMFGTGGRHMKELTATLTVAPVESATVIVVAPPATDVTVKATAPPFTTGVETSTICGSATVRVAVPRIPETSTCAGVAPAATLAGLADRPEVVESGAELGPLPQAVSARSVAATPTAGAVRYRLGIVLRPIKLGGTLCLPSKSGCVLRSICREEDSGVRG